MTISSELTRVVEPVNENDYIRGNVDARVTFVEYGEFECPDCGRAFHTIKDVLEDLQADVRFVFRHFARDEVHPFSERSAEAAEAAGAQGRFWEMHDFLFTHQHQLEYVDLVRHAERLGLDVERFERELAERVHLPKVTADLESGIAVGVSATPTFFIDGELHSGSYSRADLLAALRERL